MNIYSNVPGIFYTQVLFTIITIALLFFGFSIWWWMLSIFVYFLTGCLGVTVTYHRYLSHKSFKMPTALEYLFSVFAALGGTGSSIGWVMVHKSHHKYSDRDGDPHSPHIGGWKNMFSLYQYNVNILHVRPLLKSKFHLFLHKYYYLILAAWAAILLCFGLNVLLFAFIVPVAIQIWTSNISNYGNHMWGYKNYDTKDNSRNTWWIALITWGEGWHNNHHAKPWSHTFKLKWWEFDISGAIIKVIAFFSGTSESVLGPTSRPSRSAIAK